MDESGPVDLLEVPVGEAVAVLGLLGRLGVDAQMPATVAVIAFPLDLLVALGRGRRGFTPPSLGVDRAVVDQSPGLLNCLWVPKSCATWADVLQYAGGSVGRLVSARPTGGGMIFGLWA